MVTDLESEAEVCPLCCAPDSEFFWCEPPTRRRRGRQVARRNVREYRYCRECDLVFVPAAYLLDAETEARIYAEHQNSPTDQGYRRFLSRLMDPMLERLQPGAEGLDFGSGPGPTLSQMFAEHGFGVQIYDPIYAPETQVLNRVYPFVTCTEVLEHMYFPYQNLKLLWRLVQPGGMLGIMTSLRPEVGAFKTWRYKDDQTHVRFYSRHTMHWLAQCLDAKLEFAAHDAMIFTRSPDTNSFQPGDSYV